MSRKRHLKELRERGRHLRKLRESIEKNAAPLGPGVWSNAGLWSDYDRLAFPGGLERQKRLLAQHDPEAVEGAIQFLEVDPVFFRSGYIKEGFLRRLKRAPLTPGQREHLQKIILRRVDEGVRAGREFQYYCRLARVLQTPEFRSELQRRLEADDEGVTRRAQWMLEVMKS